MLATDPMSMRKPENLPSMDIIKDAPNQDRNRGNFDILSLLLSKINLYHLNLFHIYSPSPWIASEQRLDSWIRQIYHF